MRNSTHAATPKLCQFAAITRGVFFMIYFQIPNRPYVLILLSQGFNSSHYIQQIGFLSSLLRDSFVFAFGRLDWVCSISSGIRLHPTNFELRIINSSSSFPPIRTWRVCDVSFSMHVVTVSLAFPFLKTLVLSSCSSWNAFFSHGFVAVVFSGSEHGLLLTCF